MSKAHTVRRIIQTVGTVMALGAMLEKPDVATGLAWSTAILALTYAASQMAFAGLASEEERRQDNADQK